MAQDLITAIILTYNEGLHIRRCINNVQKIAQYVYVVDSFSTDDTEEICSEYKNVIFLQNHWPGNQAAQFNWALDNIDIQTDWILRLDADEFLSDELIQEIKKTIPSLPKDVTGCIIKRDVIFMSKRIKYGKLKTTKLLRLWRSGYGRYENRVMDEHVVMSEGRVIELKNWFFDNNLNGIDAWIMKHIDYSNREVQTVINAGEAGSGSLEQRNKSKSHYYSLPFYFRGFLFFVLRYFFLGGFLDGKAGFVWNFMQCWWYRTLVDYKLDYLREQ